MANTFKPKQKHRCGECGWTGIRFFSRACPRCDHWKPLPVATDPAPIKKETPTDGR